ncbi:MAG: N-methyl-L-tryptophan oxidase [Planctomycetota bacterium]
MDYDLIVVGLGGVGSAALAAAARRGLRVLGIDRFEPPHGMGSSHGHSRIIRQAYFEHPDYVPLAVEAYRLWAELEAETGRRLFFQSGLLQVGPPEGEVVSGVLHAAGLHGLAIEQLSREEVLRRWPGIRVAEGSVGAFEPKAGYLLVEDCVAAHLEIAKQFGAEIETGVVVNGWRPGQTVVIETEAGDRSAKAAVIAAGPWAGELLASLGTPLEVQRKPLHWCAASEGFEESSVPSVFLFETPEGHYYGTKPLDGRGFKLAEHSGGVEVADPSTIDRGLDTEELGRVDAFRQECLPAACEAFADHAVCMYTMTADGHFVVDRLPGEPNVAIAAGLSGHGFKFAPVLGEALVGLAIDGGTDLPIGFLSAVRFG